MKKAINELARTITFTFDAASGLEPVVFDPAKASAANRDYAVLHGFAARLGDNAAIAKSKENGFTVTEAMRRDAIIELRDHYESGAEAWNVKASGTRAAPRVKAFEDLAAAMGVTYEQAMAAAATAALADIAKLGAAAETGADAAAD